MSASTVRVCVAFPQGIFDDPRDSAVREMALEAAGREALRQGRLVSGAVRYVGVEPASEHSDRSDLPWVVYEADTVAAL